MSKSNFGVGPYMRGVGAKWEFPMPDPQDTIRAAFYEKAADAGEFVFQQVTITLRELIQPLSPNYRPEVPAISKDIVEKGFKIFLSFDLLNPTRNGILYEENIPQDWEPGTYFQYDEFKDAIKNEVLYYLNKIDTALKTMDSSLEAAVDKLALCMEINGYMSIAQGDDYSACKEFFNELASIVIDTYPACQVGIYLAGTSYPSTGIIKEDCLADLADWCDYPDFDFIGCSWYPKGGSGVAYDPSNIDSNAIKDAADIVHNAQKDFMIPEIGYPTNPPDPATSSEEAQDSFVERLFDVILPNASLSEADRVCYFVLIDEDFDAIYGQDTPFESMGLRKDYPLDEENDKLAWPTWCNSIS